MNLECKICNKTFLEYFSLSKHLTTVHKMSIQEKEEYFLCYINKNADVLCPHCGNKKIFYSLSVGYKKTCGRKSCIRKEIAENYKINNLKKYGCENVYQSNVIKEKIFENMKQYNSFRGNKTEDSVYQYLISHYPDTKRNYKSCVYPFRCDFYIESLDLYIEVNAHWTHGSNAFEGTPEDLEILKQWRSKQSKYYNNAIAVWTKRDVEKRDLAKKHNINYIEIFSNRQNIIIDEIREWING